MWKTRSALHISMLHDFLRSSRWQNCENVILDAQELRKRTANFLGQPLVYHLQPCFRNFSSVPPRAKIGRCGRAIVGPREPAIVPRSGPEQPGGDSGRDASDRRSGVVALGVRGCRNPGINLGDHLFHVSLVSSRDRGFVLV
jgi:hypothetical protein